MREFKVGVHLVDEAKGLAKVEVITEDPVIALAEYILRYDPEAFDRPRLLTLLDQVRGMVDATVLVYTQALLGGALRLEAVISVHRLTKLEEVQEQLLEAS